MMSLQDRLKQIRPKPNSVLTIRQKLLRVLFIFALGALMGFLAKYTDSVSLIGDIGTLLGFWILTATLLAAWSRSPEAAALHAFLFFTAMLTSYYAYSTVLFGFFPQYYFLRWGAFALLAPIGAYIVWYARGSGWIAAVCAALAIAPLLAEGYSFYYTFSIYSAFELCAAALLLIVLPTKGWQRLRILPVAVAMAFTIEKFHLLSLLLGGL